MTEARATQTPRHLWVVGIVGLLWSAVGGSILLLLRKRVAEPVLLVSVLSMVITTIYNYGLSDGMEVVGDAFSLVFTAVIFLVALGLWLYARAMRARGVIA